MLYKDLYAIKHDHVFQTNAEFITFLAPIKTMKIFMPLFNTCATVANRWQSKWSFGIAVNLST